MDWYALSRALMFRLNGETSHELGLDMMGASERLGLLQFWRLRLHLCQQPLPVLNSLIRSV